MTAPRRRCFRFSLRTLFVVVTVFGCWLGYQLNWIRQRHAYLRTKGTWEDPVDYDSTTWHEPLPPWPLGLFGEKGETWVGVPLGVSPEEEGRVIGLFPEANGRGTPVGR